MKVENDNSCSWINYLNPRINIKSVKSDQVCDTLIKGAGYTGLLAVRKLGNLFPNQKHLSNDTFRMFLYTQLSLSKVYKKKSNLFFFILIAQIFEIFKFFLRYILKIIKL